MIAFRRRLRMPEADQRSMPRHSIVEKSRCRHLRGVLRESDVAWDGPRDALAWILTRPGAKRACSEALEFAVAFSRSASWCGSTRQADVDARSPMSTTPPHQAQRGPGARRTPLHIGLARHSLLNGERPILESVPGERREGSQGHDVAAWHICFRHLQDAGRTAQAPGQGQPSSAGKGLRDYS